jgi:hypothetical protein
MTERPRCSEAAPFLLVILPNEHLPWTHSLVDSAWHSHLRPIARFRRDEYWLCSWRVLRSQLYLEHGHLSAVPPLFAYDATQNREMIVLFF